LSFNFTPDIDHSRGFGITRKTALVAEALKLLEADNARTSYKPAVTILLSARSMRANNSTLLIDRARKELLIYDPKIADPGILRALSAIQGREGPRRGAVGRKNHSLDVRPLSDCVFIAHHHSRRSRSLCQKPESACRRTGLTPGSQVIVRGSKLVASLLKPEAD
jgi:hypothetical protein